MSTITTRAGRAVRPERRERAAGADRLSSDSTTAEAATGIARITPKAVWALVAVALVAALAMGATRGREWYAAQQTEKANAAAVAAARQHATNFVTVDFQKVAEGTKRVQAGATGEFLKSYTASMKDLEKVLVANKTVSTVQRSEVALVSGDLDSAIVLVGVVAPTTNTAVPKGETKTYRMRLELRTVNDAWKVENLEFVG